MGKLIFMHLPKTAGSTLASILVKQYGADAVLPLYDSTYGEEIEHLPQDQIDRASVIMGHFYYGVHAYLAEPSLYVTMLREPVERVVSHYFYVRRDPSHYLHTAAKEMNLSEYVIHCNLCEPNNDQTRLLAGGDLANSLGTCSPEMLSAAKRHLRENFAVVGIAEEFDLSLILLMRVLRWRLPYYVRSNVTRSRPAIQDISPETVRTIQAYNQMDCELYHFGRELFQEKIALQGDSFIRTVKTFKQFNSLLGKLYAYK